MGVGRKHVPEPTAHVRAGPAQGEKTTMADSTTTTCSCPAFWTACFNQLCPRMADERRMQNAGLLEWYRVASDPRNYPPPPGTGIIEIGKKSAT